MRKEATPPVAQPRNRLIIGFAGPTGAGKTTGAEYLARTYSFEYLRYSMVLAEWLSEDDKAKVALQATGWQVMSSGLQGELNQCLIARVQPSKNYAIDGLRHPIDDACLKAAFAPTFLLIYIDAKQKTRFQRTLAAGRFCDFASFRLADRHPVERPLRRLRSLAFAVVRNEDSLSDYQHALDRRIDLIAKRLGGTP